VRPPVVPEESRSATQRTEAAVPCGKTSSRRLPAIIAGILVSSALLFGCGNSTQGQGVRQLTVPAALLAGEAGAPRCDDTQHYCMVRTDGGDFIALYTYDTNTKFRARGCQLTWEPERQFVDQSGAAGAGAFHSACSGAVYDSFGRLAFGAVPRDMDRFPVKKAVTGDIWVDVSRLICGEAHDGRTQSCDLAATVATPATPTPAAAASAAAPSSTATATAAATTTPAAASTPAASNNGGATTLQLIAKNTLFDKNLLQASAGAITIAMDNQDGGIPHNIHVYKGKDNTGEDMGKTEFEAGPVKQTLTLTLAAGEYFFVCDVHPATMSGKLEVQ
jgi:plastocyanin